MTEQLAEPSAVVAETGSRRPVGRIFVSYASADRTAADRLVMRLERTHIQCWIAHRDIPIGESWAGAIARAIASSNALLVLVTPSANRSRQVAREVEMADEARKLLLPAVVTGVQLSDELRFFLSSAQQVVVADFDDPMVIDRVCQRLSESGSLSAEPSDLTTADRLAKQIARPSDATIWRVYASTPSRVVGVGFYVLSMLIMLSPHRQHVVVASYVLAFIAGIVVVARTKQLNLPVLFTIGFLQPLVMFVGQTWNAPHLASHALPIVTTATVGLTCAAGGLVMSLRFGVPRVRALSLRDWRTWVVPDWNLLRRGEKLEASLKVVVLIAAVILLALVTF
jgi:hypothetical protein